jgi:hypothetical protein
MGLVDGVRMGCGHMAMEWRPICYDCCILDTSHWRDCRPPKTVFDLERISDPPVPTYPRLESYASELDPEAVRDVTRKPQISWISSGDHPQTSRDLPMG